MPLSTLVSSISNSKKRLKEPHYWVTTLQKAHHAMITRACARCRRWVCWDDTNIHEDSRMPMTIKRPLLASLQYHSATELVAWILLWCWQRSAFWAKRQSQRIFYNRLWRFAGMNWTVKISGDGSGEENPHQQTDVIPLKYPMPF